MQAWLACTIALLLVPLAAGAEIFSHGIGSEGYWTNNLYGGGSDDEIDDGSIRVLPFAEVQDPEGDLSWSLRYAPSYEYFMKESAARGADHDVSGSMNWRMTPTTSLSLSDTFQRTHTIARFNEATEPGEDLLLQSRRSRVKANYTAAELQHLLSPVDVLTFTGSYSFQDLSTDEGTDGEFLSGGLLFRHLLSERTSIGSRFSFSRQTAKPGDRLSESDPDRSEQEILLSEDRDTDYYNLAAVLNHEFSPTLRLAFSAGPALVVTDQAEPFPSDATTAVVSRFPLISNNDGNSFVDANSCPSARLNGAKVHFLGAGCRSLGAPLSDAQLFALNVQTQGNTLTVPIDGVFGALDNENLTYFADATLTKDWQRWTAQLTYRRSENRSSNFGAISDVMFGRLHWQLTSRLSSSVLASYELREQANEFQTSVQVVQNAETPLPAFPQGALSQSLQRVTLDNDLSLDVISFAWHVNYQLGERAELYTIFDYRDESPQQAASTVLEDVTRFSVTVGVRYSFAPIPF